MFKALALTVSRSGSEERTVRVEALPFVLGSGEGCDLVLKAPGIKDPHGRVELGEDGSPVYLPARGGRRVVLEVGKGFRVGPFQLKVVSGDAAADPGTDAERPLAALLDVLPSLWEDEDPSGALLDALRRGFDAQWGALLAEDTGTWEVRRTSGARPGAGADDRVSRTVMAELDATGEPVVADDVMDHPTLAEARSLPMEVRSVIASKLPVPGRGRVAVYLESARARQAYTAAESLLLERVGALAAEQLRRAQESRVLRAESARLGELHRRARAGDPVELVGESEAMRRLRDEVARAADTDITVLVLGETGTGKELVARAVHEGSGRTSHPFVALNCAAIPEALAESELFGHRAGSFSGATEDRMGRFELAHRGTLFLDELGDLPLALQPKLLRVLEQREVERLGGGGAIPVDVRVVAATHRDLAERVRDERFREDLYFRLSVFVIQVPPLRERVEDIPLLAARFMEAFNLRETRAVRGLDDGARKALMRHRWPGNVRELRNVIEMGCVRARGDTLTREDLSFAPTLPGLGDLETYEDARQRFEKELFTRALRAADADATEAARVLGLSRSQVYRKIEEYGIDLRALRRGEA